MDADKRGVGWTMTAFLRGPVPERRGAKCVGDGVGSGKADIVPRELRARADPV